MGAHTRHSLTFPKQELIEEELTPLQERLEKLAGYLGKWGYIFGFMIFLAMTVFLVLDIMFSDAALLENATLLSLLRMFTTAVAVVIVAIPEGLPLAVSISMAFSVDVMKKDNLLVKKMVACENLGYVSEICTGKTATLTQNQMQVEQLYCGSATCAADKRTLELLHPAVKDVLVDCIIMNCDSRVEMSEDA